MPEFHLDTSGAVGVSIRSTGAAIAPDHVKWSDLDAFTQGYIEALFFTDNAPNAPDRATFEAQCASGENEGSVPGDYGFSDLAPETLARIIADCAAFLASPAWRTLGADQLSESPADLPDDVQAGRDFWYTRNGHGCGFWDGDWPEPFATYLDNAAKEFRSVDSYLGDDGLIYMS